MTNITKKSAALLLATRAGIDLKKDFFTLSNSAVVKLGEIADVVGYRRPKHANGSRARYFFAYLQRGR